MPLVAWKVSMQQLIDGKEAKEVIAEMWKTYTTLQSMDKHMSKVRTAMKEGCHCSKKYNESIKPLSRFVQDEPEILEFFTAPLKKQCQIQKDHEINPTWSEDAEKALANVQLLPPNMKDFHLTKSELVKLKRTKAQNLTEKNRSVITVQEGEKVLRLVTAMLDTSTPSDGYARLLCCLAAVSGRRKTEILSPRSEFEAVEGSSTMTLFTGQLKTKNEDDDLEYVIPLLCPYQTFKRGLDCLRAKQKDNYGLEDLAALTNEAIGDKYNFIKRDLSRGAVPPFAPFEIKDLRSFYAACVFKCYVCPHTFNATACQILGHRDIQESLHYSNVRVEELGALEGSLGPLP
jgi:hypothetical protein